MTDRSHRAAIIVFMMTQQLEISILAAPLAAIDRRALSQAWYSALRLARDEQIPFTSKPRRMPVFVPVALREPAAPSEAVDRRSAPKRTESPVRSNAPRCSDSEARNACRLKPRSPIVRTKNNGYADSRGSCKRATFTLGRGRARIHVVIQTKGARTTLVALCRPELRGFVARALTEARLALAARGIGVELAAQGVRRCS